MAELPALVGWWVAGVSGAVLVRLVEVNRAGVRKACQGGGRLRWGRPGYMEKAVVSGAE
jgi:hypothetical protein